jgi:hypothetical protein
MPLQGLVARKTVVTLAQQRTVNCVLVMLVVGAGLEFELLLSQ